MKSYDIFSFVQVKTTEKAMRKLNVEKVCDLIVLRGMTVSEFARRLGEQQQTVQKWTSGKRNPKPANLSKIAAQLGVSVSEISTIVFSVSKNEILELDREIEEITGLWGHLPKDQRQTILSLIRSIAGSNIEKDEPEARK